MTVLVTGGAPIRLESPGDAVLAVFVAPTTLEQAIGLLAEHASMPAEEVAEVVAETVDRLAGSGVIDRCPAVERNRS